MVEAGALLRGNAPFVADTSAWWRIASLPNELGTLVADSVVGERFWITPVVRMEILYSARTSSEFVALEMELDALRILRNDRAIADTAMRAIGELAERGDGYHRADRRAHRRSRRRTRRPRRTAPRRPL